MGSYSTEVIANNISGIASGSDQGRNFKLVEEETLALLLLLLKVFAETTVSGPASEMRCMLVVALPQAAVGKMGRFWIAVNAAYESICRD